MENLVKSDGTKQLSAKVTEIEKEIQKLKNERGRINTAYLDMETLTKEEYVERVKNNEKRTSELNAQRANLLSVIVSSTEKNERVGVIKGLYDSIKDKIENASYDVQTSLLRVFANRIDLNFATNTADVSFKFF